VEKSKLLDFSIMLVFWSLASLVRNSVVLAVYLLFSVACFFTVHGIYQGLLSRCDAQLTERIFETHSAAISKICPQIFEKSYCEIHPGMIYWTKFTAAK